MGTILILLFLIELLLHTDKDVALKSEKRVGLLDTLSDVMNVELPKEFFADCAVWDFAGQKEFYATHQTFLTNCAIHCHDITEILLKVALNTINL
jgi:GTPase SAR1 family protein